MFMSEIVVKFQTKHIKYVTVNIIIRIYIKKQLFNGFMMPFLVKEILAEGDF